MILAIPRPQEQGIEIRRPVAYRCHPFIAGDAPCLR